MNSNLAVDMPGFCDLVMTGWWWNKIILLVFSHI